MKQLFRSLFALLALLTAALLPVQSRAQDPIVDAIEVVRSVYQADRQAFVMDALQLNADETAAFMPLYEAYRRDIDNLGDDLVKLVLEYADYYPDVPADRAQRLLKQYTAIEKKLAGKQA